jgi:hypothetical protein
LASTESPFSNSCDAIGNIVKHDGLWDDDSTLVATTLFGNLCGQCLLIEAVIDTIDNFFFHNCCSLLT